MKKPNDKVLVTGGTGFLAGWTIRKLLEKGYHVRTTVRSDKKIPAVQDMFTKEGVDITNLSFAFADLTRASGWREAMEGMDIVLHLASPLGGNNQEDPSLIPTARSGVENVIQAAIDAGVKKIVMTSSEAACYPGRKYRQPTADESFWTDVNNKEITNYMRSKIIAEKTAWGLIRRQDRTKLVTILPGAILGPFMAGRRSSTDPIFEMLLKGTPSPNVVFSVSDVRDLAELHIMAMENPAADGQRFLAHGEDMTMPQMARILKAQYPDRKIKTSVVPDFMIHIMAKSQTAMKVLNTMVGMKYKLDSTKARKVLGWNPRPARETVLDTAAYMIMSKMV
ncbi:MAG: NAD-dependent epimerase/dehydratase family protein [Bilifractor sp.]|jgi:dihydroflavonol-4-reductase